jgi:hypothetical protein
VRFFDEIQTFWKITTGTFFNTFRKRVMHAYLGVPVVMKMETAGFSETSVFKT